MTLEFKQHTLANGLQIVAELNPSGYTAAFGFFVRSGARDEGPEERGLSHFLEHMVFKGTARRTAADVNRELDELGGQANAYTSEEQTVYYTTVLPKYQDRAIDLLCDIMRPALRDDDFQTERQVILEEIAKYDDQPPFGAFETSMELYFAGHPLGSRVLGTPESIGEMTSTAMRKYFERRYDPKNMVLSAAGCVDFDALVSQVESLASQWPTAAMPAMVPAPTSGGQAKIELEVPDSSQTYVIRVGAAPPNSSTDRFAMRMLVSMMGEEGGSRLFWDLIDTGRADVATMWTQEFQDAGLLFTYLSCAPEDVDANLALIDGAIEVFVKNGPAEDEIEQAKNRMCAGLILSSERPSNRMFSIGNAWQIRGVYETLDDQLKKYRSVDADDLQRVLAAYPMHYTTEVRTVSKASAE
ncbi:Protease 3 precursor [Rosistilla carotiformis]|uniref:Protease 3 n=1 Tax=Rosistilla carotiformis TaxID=2528017 RepID=A0A518JT00_9BACT|nr:pitrilysin family protein [Rosistilla carotiformis]QDV68660.1 Protease 3 precursor [Rosistilla carotiformis]